jgi:hypothetical protein
MTGFGHGDLEIRGLLISLEPVKILFHDDCDRLDDLLVVAEARFEVSLV